MKEEIDCTGAQKHGAADRCSSETEALGIEGEQDRWASVFRAVTDALLVTGPDGVILAVNEAALTLLAIPRSDIIGRTLGGVKRGLGYGLVLTPVGRPDSVEEHFLHLLQEHGELAGYEYWLTNGEGEEHCLRVSGTVVQDAYGDPDRFVFTLKDITELRAVERDKDHFVQLMGHELRHPLQVISGLITVLRAHVEAQQEAKAGAYVQALDEQAQQLSELVNEMFTA